MPDDKLDFKPVFKTVHSNVDVLKCQSDVKLYHQLARYAQGFKNIFSGFVIQLAASSAKIGVQFDCTL